jgi:hypothetical protein
VAALRAHIDGDTEPISEMLSSELVIRESTAAPPSATRGKAKRI